MTPEDVKRRAETFIKVQRQREWLTASGFGVLALGCFGQFGVWPACLVCGSIVFGLGLYGLTRG